jgi:hypothetical protein
VLILPDYSELRLFPHLFGPYASLIGRFAGLSYFGAT